MEKPDKRKEINVDLTPSQMQTLLRVNFAPAEHVKALNKLKVIFYSTRVLCVFYQEEIAPENQLYKTKFLQYKFWATKSEGGKPHEQQPYLKPISRQNMESLANDFGFELPEPSQTSLELKRKSEQVAQLESTVGDLTKKLQMLEAMIKTSLTENKGGLSRQLSSFNPSEDDSVSKKKSNPTKPAGVKKPKLNADGGNFINKANLSAALNDGVSRKLKKSMEKEKAALASASKKNEPINLELISQEEDENLYIDGNQE